MRTMDYIIATDADSELRLDFVKAQNVPVFPMPLMMDGVEYNYDLGLTVSVPDFFERLSAGAEFSTSCKPPWEVKEWFKKLAEEQNKNILYVGLSNKLSQHFNNCVMAANELMEEDPSVHITLVDTLSISAGQSILLHKAYELREQGLSLEENAAWLEENKQRVCLMFSVDDLNYLRRGGRLSGGAAFFGTVLDIKPIIHCTEEGRLEPREKAKGRRKAWRRMAEFALERLPEGSPELILIYATEDGRDLFCKLMREARPDVQITMLEVGPVIGGHAGPGVLGMAFIAKD